MIFCITLGTLAGLGLAVEHRGERIEVHNFSIYCKLAAVLLEMCLVFLWITGVIFTFTWIIQRTFWWMLPMEILLPLVARSCGNWVLNNFCCKIICWWDRGDPVESYTAEIV